MHTGAIHDVQWSRSDTQIASAGGDGVVSIHDASTSQSTSILFGHTDAVKCVGWNVSNPSILYTGGRDEEIMLWDLRVSHAGRIIHRMKAKPPKKTKGMEQPKMSITSIVQATSGQKELISASASDGYVV